MTAIENTPTITDWLSGIGTAGALLVSTVLAFVSIVLAYRDRKAKRNAEAMERARVFAHVDVDDSQLTWSVVNASPYPVRQVNVMAVPFYDDGEGKKLHHKRAHLTCKYIAPNSTHEEALPKATLPDDMQLPRYMDHAVRLDFVDYQGTHWVRTANGKVTPIEKLKGSAFEQFPRAVYDFDRPTRSRIPRWMRRLTFMFKQHADK